MPEVPPVIRAILPANLPPEPSVVFIMMFFCWLEAPLPMITAVRTHGLAHGTIDSRRAQAIAVQDGTLTNGSRLNLVKKPRFCGFFSGGEAPAFVSLHRLFDEKSSLALRPLFSGQKISVEWMFIALWTAIAIGLVIWRRRCSVNCPGAARTPVPERPARTAPSR